MTEANKTGEPLGLDSTAGLGLATERDAVLMQLDDRTNQTWARKRKRWAALVRAQDAEIERLRTELAEWQKLRDPVTLHVSLLRGFPAKLDAATFLHIGGHDQLMAAERERCAKLCECWMEAAERESGPEAAGWLHQVAQHMRNLKA